MHVKWSILSSNTFNNVLCKSKTKNISFHSYVLNELCQISKDDELFWIFFIIGNVSAITLIF